MVERCVCCGEVIPEGRQVCINCERGVTMANKYVPRLVAAETFAQLFTLSAKEPEEKYKLITDWASKHLVYDFVKAAKVAKLRGIYPDPVACWMSHKGICQDIASLVVIMLRAVGIKSYLCIGYADRNHHAWVQAYIAGRVYRYDHDGTAKVYRLEKQF